MLTPTPMEEKALLLLFKEFGTNYNANSLAQKLNITRRGALKIVKHLHQQELLLSRKYGKAVFYKINFKKEYARQLLKVLLMGEVEQKARRWLFEFQELSEEAEAIILFGSMVRNEEKAHDMDLVLVVKKEKFSQAEKIVQKENRLLLKPIHPVWQLPSDIVRNLKIPDPVLLNALRFGYVLHGYDLVISAVQEAQEAHGSFAVPMPEPR